MKNLMKYLVGVIIVAVLAAGGYFAYDYMQKNQLLGGDEQVQQGSTSQHARSIEQLISNSENKNRDQTLVVGVDAHFPPMVFTRGDGSIVGFDVDILKDIAKSLGKELVIRPIDWSKKLQELDSGRVDLLSSGFVRAKSREKNYAMSNPYFVNRIVTMVPQDSPIVEMDELGNKVIGAQKGVVYYLDALKDFTNSKGQGVAEVKADYSDVGAALSGMLQGDTDAVILESSIARYYSRRSPDTFRILDGEFATVDLVYGAQRENVQLINKLNQAISKVIESETFKTANAEWFGAEE